MTERKAPGIEIVRLSPELREQIDVANSGLSDVILAVNKAIPYWKEGEELPEGLARELHGAVDLAVFGLEKLMEVGTMRYSPWDAEAERLFSAFQDGCREIVREQQTLQAYLIKATWTRYSQLAKLCDTLLGRIEATPTLGAPGTNWNAGANRPGAERHSAPVPGPDGIFWDVPDNSA